MDEDAAIRELNEYVKAWQHLRQTGSNICLWEDPELVGRVMAEMGRRGGAKRNPRKGFGSSHRRASKAGKKGALRRWAKYRQQQAEEPAE